MSDANAKHEVLALMDSWLALVRQIETQAQNLDETILRARNNVARDIIEDREISEAVARDELNERKAEAGRIARKKKKEQSEC